jgi:hypothetical protein
MAGNTYDVGSVVEVIGTFKDKNGALVDPTDVIIKYTPPGAAVVTKTFLLGQVTRDSLGVFYFDIDTGTTPGKWKYRFESTGYKAAGDATFFVSDSPMK